MTMGLELTILIALLVPLAGLGLGMLCLRRVGLRPAERLPAGVGVGLLATFVLAFASFALGLGKGGYWAVTGIALVAWLVAAPDIARLLRRRRGTRLLAGSWIGLLLASLLCALSVRNLSAGRWVLDWLEHFQRTDYFLGKLGNDFQYIFLYALPARPPLQNVLTAWACAHVLPEYSFTTFQLTTAALGSVVFLACAPLVSLFVGGVRRVRRGPLYLALACVLLLAPNYIAHDLFPWTKLLSAFYVLSGLALYLRTGAGQRRFGERGRITLVAALLAAGCLVHYSACPFALLIGLHWFVTRWRRGGARTAADLLLPIGVAALLLSLWLGWSVGTFGLKQTAGANTTIRDSTRQGIADNARKYASNLARSFIPHFTYMSYRELIDGIPGSLQYQYGLKQNSSLGLLRDYTFMLYTAVLPLAAGSGGAVLLSIGLWRDLLARRQSLGPRRGEQRTQSPRTSPSRRAFWWYFLLGALLLGVLEHGEPNQFGITNVVWVPLIFLAIPYVVAKAAALRPGLRGPMLLGWAIDALLCTLPQIICQSRTFTAEATLPEMDRIFTHDPQGLSYLGLSQFFNQRLYHLELFTDLAPACQGPILGAAIATVLGAVVLLGFSLSRASSGPALRYRPPAPPATNRP